MKDKDLLQLLPEDVKKSAETIRSYLDKAKNVYRDTLNVTTSANTVTSTQAEAHL